MPYTQIFYQIVFATKHREPVLLEENQEKLHRYIWGILHDQKCFSYQINGMEDHLHIATHIHPTVALSDLMKDIKVASSHWIKENKMFPGFTNWQDSYGAFTYSRWDQEMLINYVKNQKEHHRKKTFIEEYKELLKEHGVEYNEKYLL
jgi:putative transposase